MCRGCVNGLVGGELGRRIDEVIIRKAEVAREKKQHKSVVFSDKPTNDFIQKVRSTNLGFIREKL